MADVRDHDLQKSIDGYNRVFSDGQNGEIVYINDIGASAIIEGKEGIFISVNKSFLRTFGYSEDDLIGFSALSIICVDVEGIDALRSRAESEVKNRGVSSRYEFRFRDKRGNIVWGELIVFGLGDNIRMVKIYDITPMKVLEAELCMTAGIYKERLPDHIQGRQKEVARLAANGLSSQEIADDLNLSKTTIDNYRTGLRQRLKIPKEESLQSFLSKFRF